MEAGEGTRTLDLRLGKPTLYQLSYARVRGVSLAPSGFTVPSHLRRTLGRVRRLALAAFAVAVVLAPLAARGDAAG